MENLGGILLQVGIWTAVGIVVLIILCGSLFTVKEKTCVVIQRLGKFHRIAKSGLNFKIPIIDSKAGVLNMKVQQLDVEVETKTLDNVFVGTKVSVQYYVLPDKVREAYYELDNPEQQIESYVFDTVRAEVPKLKLDEVFAKKDDIANAIKKELSETMDDFGHGIVKALMTDIDPAKCVKDSMNAINEAQRLRMAAEEKGEADRIIKVKAAEAEAQSKKLQGEGIANQRKAIIEGLRESTENLASALASPGAREVMQLIMITQYFDTIGAFAKDGKTNAILLNHSPSGLTGVIEEMRNAVIVGNQVPTPAPDFPLAEVAAKK